MGCCQTLSSKEKIIIAKEQRLNFNKLTAQQIKNVHSLKLKISNNHFFLKGFSF